MSTNANFSFAMLIYFDPALSGTTATIRICSTADFYWSTDKDLTVQIRSSKVKLLIRISLSLTSLENIGTWNWTKGSGWHLMN